MVQQEDFCKALCRLAFCPACLSSSETCIMYYTFSSFYTHKVNTHNLIKWALREQNSHRCKSEHTYILKIWLSQKYSNFQKKKADHYVFGSYCDACPQSVPKKIHFVLKICPKHMKARHKIIEWEEGITFTHDFNVLCNFLFRQNEITRTSQANSRILSGIYLPAKPFIHHSQPSLGTKNALSWVKLNHKVLQSSL